MYTYYIKVQFAKADAPSFFDVQDQIEDGISFFNARSLIARNPKQIIRHSVSTDGSTLAIVLESSVELPVPAKSLRVLTTYLISKDTPNDLSAYITGKQLFKMRVDDTLPAPISPCSVEEDINQIKIDLIRSVADSTDLPLLKKINLMLAGE